MDLLCHADLVGTTLVHIPLVFDSSDHQVNWRRQNGIPARASMPWTPTVAVWKSWWRCWTNGATY